MAAQVRDDVFPTLLEGRAPERPDEITLGSRTLARVHRRVGQSVPVEVAGATRTMRIVGRAIFPLLGQGTFTPTGLGEGAAVVASQLLPDTGAVPGPAYNFVLAQTRPGTDHSPDEPTVRRLLQAAGCTPVCDPFTGVVTVQRPTDIGNYARVR